MAATPRAHGAGRLHMSGFPAPKWPGYLPSEFIGLTGIRSAVAITSPLESPPGGSMRQQTKPFIVEKKPSRKPKSGAGKPSIWGKLDLSLDADHHGDAQGSEATAAGGDDRRQ